MITDPLFYAFAIPAVLILGISKAGFGSAFGSLAVPLIALTITVPQATAILLPVLFVMDMLGLKAYWGQADWTLLKRIMPAGLVGIALGFLLFKQVDTKWVGALVGATGIAFVGLRAWQTKRAGADTPAYTAPTWVAWLCASTSGFTSFVAHAGGPPLGIYTIPLKMPPVNFVASMTVFFAVINLAKWVPYAQLGLLSRENVLTSLVLIAFAPIGNWIGLRIANTIDLKLFYRIVNVALIATGIKLIVDAFR